MIKSRRKFHTYIYIYTLRLGYSEILFQIKKLYSEENDTLCITLTNTTKCLNFIEESKSTVAYEFAQFSITFFPHKFLEVVGIRWLCILQQVNNIIVLYVVKNICLVTDSR